jgi:hypothetical protein
MSSKQYLKGGRPRKENVTTDGSGQQRGMKSWNEVPQTKETDEIMGKEVGLSNEVDRAQECGVKVGHQNIQVDSTTPECRVCLHAQMLVMQQAPESIILAKTETMMECHREVRSVSCDGTEAHRDA